MVNGAGESQNNLKFVQLFIQKLNISRTLLAFSLSFIILSSSILAVTLSYAQSPTPNESSHNATIANITSNQSIQVNPSIFGNHTLSTGKPVLVKFLGTVNVKGLPKPNKPPQFMEVENPPPSPQLGEIFKKRFQSLMAFPTKGKFIELEVGEKKVSVESGRGDPTVIYQAFNGRGGDASPAEPSVAAGPDYVMETVNVSYEIYDSHFGNVVTGDYLQNFFSSATYGSNAVQAHGDARVIFDTTSQRFFLSMDDNANNIHTVDFAVSDSSDPTGNWHAWSITFSGWADQPKIATSLDKFVIDARDADHSDGAEVAVLDKNQLVSGASNPRAQIFSTDSFSYSPYPVSTTINDLYEVEKDHNTQAVVIHTITGDPTTFSSYIYVSQMYWIQPEQPEVPGKQPPTSQNIEIDARGDDEVQTAAWSATGPIAGYGQIWFGLNEGCNPPGDSTTESCLHIVQLSLDCLSPLVCTPSQDIIMGLANYGFYFPALSLDSSNNMNLIFGYSSLSVNPSLAVTGHAFSDPQGSFTIPVTIVTSNGPATFDSGRYGDYYGAATDPTNSNLVWVAGMYTDNGSPVVDATMIAEVQTSANPIAVPPMPPFASIQCLPDSLDIVGGSSETTTCFITPQNGFDGTISLYVGESIAEPVSLDNYNPHVFTCSLGRDCMFERPTEIQLTPSPGPINSPYSYSITINGYITSGAGQLDTVSNPVEINVIPQSYVATTNQIQMRLGAGGDQECVAALNCFYPNIINISPGETVTWTNNDRTGHTTTSGQPTDNRIGTVWDSSLVKSGGTYSFTFHNEGDYKYFCEVHPWMTGEVIVSGSPIAEFGSLAPIILVISILSIIILSFKTRFLQRI